MINKSFENKEIEELSAKITALMIAERKQRRLSTLENGFYSTLSKAFASLSAKKEKALNEGKTEEYMQLVLLEGRLKKDFSYYMQMRMSKILQYAVYENAREWPLEGPEAHWFADASTLYRNAIKEIEGDSL